MAVVEVVRALGSWNLQMSADTPQEIADLILDGKFGHVAVDAARDNPEVLGDELLSTARYVGVLRGISHEADRLALSGSGMAFWLGAEDGLGDVFEAPVPFQDAAFEFVAAGLLPPSGAVTAGTFTAPTGYQPYTQTHRYQTSRQALDYFCDLRGCDWRVNGDATLDVGPPEALFAVEPRAAVIARAEGVDMDLRALPGAARLDSDVQDFSTRVVTLAEGEGTAIAVGTADITVNPYVDMHGNPIKLTRLVSESNTSATNANDRAAIALAQYTAPRDSLTVSTATHDIRGDVQPGDRVWVYDPSAGLVDTGNERVFRGDRISPVLLRVFQVNWPVEAGMGVYFRTPDGRWFDLTDYVEFENSDTALTVGGYDRALTNQQEPVGWRPNATNQADSSIPGVPTWTAPFDIFLTVGQGGLSRGNVQLTWIPPTQNTDGSSFVDGANFEIRYRRADFQPTWADLGGTTWGDLADKPWGALSGTAVDAEEWTYTVAPIDTSSLLLQDLDPGQGYEVEIRAIDGANPPNAGDWTAPQQVWVGADTIPPATPAAPVVAASLVQVSVRHTLGLASGGTFNLPDDLAYLEVHVGDSETFTVSDATRVGKVIATRAQIAAQVTVVGAFPVATPDQVWVRVIAVDQSGNESTASAAAAATVELIDSQWVSDLTADKITAGDFTASYGLVGLFTAGNPTGARFSAGYDGSRNGFMLHRPSASLALHGDANTGDLVAYAPDGVTRTFRVEADTGNVYLYKDGTTPALQLTAATGLIDMVGKLTAGAGIGSGPTIVVNPGSPPVMSFYPSASTQRTFLTAQTTTRPDGTTSAGWEIGTANAASLYDGFAVNSWVGSNGPVAWIGNKVTSGGWAGGIVKLERDSNFALIGVEGGGRLSIGGNLVTVVSPGQFLLDGPADTRINIQTGSLEVSVNVNNRLQLGTGGSQLISNGSVKSFVIDHPLNESGQPPRWLVHCATESPTAGVEYSGTAVIEDHLAVVALPVYFEALCEPEGRAVFLQPELGTFEGMAMVSQAAPSEIKGGRFHIVCPAPDGTRVHWLVKATRKDASFDPEPLASQVQVHGDGPYRYLTAAA